VFIAESIPRYGAIDRSHPLARGLVACYSVLPGMASGIRWYNLAGNNHGTLTNGPVWRGDSLSFDGSNDYVDASPYSTSNSQAVSVFARINFSTLTNFQGVATNLRTSPFNGWVLYTHGDGTIGTYLGSHRRSTATITTSTKNHIGFTFGGGVVTAYINGVSVRSDSGVSYTGNTGLRIGSFYTDTITEATLAAGLINDVRIYSRALNAAEVKSLYVDPLAIFNRTGTPIGRVASSPPTGNRRRRLIMGAAT
jgi:hypothetical protein